MHTSLTLNPTQISNCQLNVSVQTSGSNGKSKIYPTHGPLNPPLYPWLPKADLLLFPTSYCHHHLPRRSGCKLRSYPWFPLLSPATITPCLASFQCLFWISHSPFLQDYLSPQRHLISRGQWSQPIHGSLGLLSWILTQQRKWSFQNVNIRTLPWLPIIHRWATAWGALQSGSGYVWHCHPRPQPNKPSSPLDSASSGCHSHTCCSLFCLECSPHPPQSSHGWLLVIPISAPLLLLRTPDLKVSLLSFIVSITYIITQYRIILLLFVSLFICHLSPNPDVSVAGT